MDYDWQKIDHPFGIGFLHPTWEVWRTIRRCDPEARWYDVTGTITTMGSTSRWSVGASQAVGIGVQEVVSEADVSRLPLEELKGYVEEKLNLYAHKRAITRRTSR